MAPKPKKASALDTNSDGKISPAEANAGDSILGDLGIAAGPGAVAASRGAPLLPYQVSDPSALDGVTFQDNSLVGKAAAAATGKKQGRVGVRYYEQDTLTPLQWSPELRAQLQRSLYEIGLYGKDKVTLGSWGAADQAAFSELLSQANVDGREWFEQMAFWRAHPPQDLLSKIAGTQPKKPTFQVSNPIDIRTAAESVSQGLTGRVDRGFVDTSVGGYQQAEKAAQEATYNDQAAGGGGTTTAQPQMQNYLQDRIRREQPLQVDGYSFLNGFDTFLGMVGGK